MKNTARLGARRVLLRSVAAHTVSLAPLHEPERRPPARREPAAWSNDRAGPEAGAPIPRFMVPMHAQERKEAFPEPRAKAGASSTHSKRCRAVAERLGLREAFGVRPASRRFPWVMVPMHAHARNKTVHEPIRTFPSSVSFSWPSPLRSHRF